MFDLKRTQDFFWNLMQSPKGIGENPEGGEVPLSKIFLEHRAGEAANGLENYSQMYFWRFSDSFNEDFPLSAAFAGREAFGQILVDYVLQNPSRYRDLAEFSGGFPNFLAHYPTVRTGDLGFLAELAQLEWWSLKVQRDKDPRPLTRETLSHLPPEAWAELKLKRIDASEVMSVHWNLFPLWEKIQGEKTSEKLKIPEFKSSQLLIWRKKFTPMVLEISPQEADCLRFLKQPESFQGLCEKIHQDDPRESARLAAGYLQGWIERQLVERC